MPRIQYIRNGYFVEADPAFRRQRDVARVIAASVLAIAAIAYGNWLAAWLATLK